MTAPGSSILCVGAAHEDIIGRAAAPLGPGGDVPGTVVGRPGGVALNVALGLADLGAKVRLCAALGDDPVGDGIIAAAGSRGVDCAPSVRVPGGWTDRYIAIEDAAGELVAAVADAGLLEAHAEAVVAAAVQSVAKAGAVFLEANLPGAALAAIGRRAREAGAELVVNPVSPARAPRLAAVLSAGLAPTVIANLAEAGVLTGRAPATTAAAAEALLRRGAGAAVVTDGARPAALAGPEGCLVLAPAPVPDASVTGAGDACIAGYLACAARASDPGAALAAALAAAERHLRSHAR